MKHLAAFEFGILDSRPCCRWQDVTPCESPVMPNWPHTHRASCPAEDQRHYHNQNCDFYSSNFGLTGAHVKEAVATSMEAAGFRGRYRFKYETQCCLGHLGQGVASEKDCLCSVCFSSCLKQSHHCCSCWNIVAQGGVTQKLVYSEEVQFTRSWYSIHPHILGTDSFSDDICTTETSEAKALLRGCELWICWFSFSA